MPGYYIGLMSGTSLDGVDAAICDFSSGNTHVSGHLHLPFSAELRAELLSLNQAGGCDELRRCTLAASSLARLYAGAVLGLLETHRIEPSDVAAIGCHGQTVRHQPDAGYTVQLVNGALLAELTGISVVCDFRSRDIAAGGQGAPLVPAFHQAIFGCPDKHRIVVNIGGIANLTSLPPSGAVTGFDCGPGNMLMDAWAQRHRNVPYDENGLWATSGKPITEMLRRMLAYEYFNRAPPKSTGRETFNAAWLAQYLNGDENPADVQATLLALTVCGIADAVNEGRTTACEVFVCGGGAQNTALMDALSLKLAPHRVTTTEVLGVSPQIVEALAFAWLAKQNLESQPGNLPAVTGANGARILGALYRA